MKYLKLYISYAKISLMSKLVYKANVIIGITGFLCTQVFSLLTLYLLINTVPNIDGYSIYEIGFLFGVTNMAMGIDHLFTDRLWTVAYNEVVRGKLDHLFLRPLPVLFQILASEIQLEAFGEIIVATVLVSICGSNLSVALSFLNVLLIIIGILCASLIFTSFKILIAGLAFIFKRSGALLQVTYNFSQYTRYPLKIFPKAIQIILLFIIPLGLCIFVPFENLFNPLMNPYLLMLVIIGITLSFFAISLIIFNVCCKKYESTGT